MQQHEKIRHNYILSVIRYYLYSIYHNLCLLEEPEFVQHKYRICLCLEIYTSLNRSLYKTLLNISTFGIYNYACVLTIMLNLLPKSVFQLPNQIYPHL